jgi:hypothetical protein
VENTTYASRLRYLDADDVDDEVVDYDGLSVIGTDGRKIGDVDGFIVDAAARRVNYVVIDSGGWFTSRRLLLPIGHAAIAEDRRSLRVDVSRDALGRFPEFDEGRFREFTDEELRAFERNTVVACCPDEPLEDVTVTSWGYDSRRHYTQPEWWRSAQYVPERLQPVQARASLNPTAPSSPAAAGGSRSGGVPDRELVTARESRGAQRDESPHLEGRAQPGDVLGIETAGERTGIGDTAEDENKRREAAERAAGEADPPSRRR